MMGGSSRAAQGIGFLLNCLTTRATNQTITDAKCLALFKHV